MKSPCALLLPLIIHHTSTHTHRSIVNVLLGEGHHCSYGIAWRESKIQERKKFLTTDIFFGPGQFSKVDFL